ncbi:MAG: Tat pathway signal protein [Pseudomonadota bacterium]
MATRRKVLAGAAVVGAAGVASVAYLASGPDVAAEAAALRAPLDLDAPTIEARNRELVRFASLAPNSHNTQPWRFALHGDLIVIRPDVARRCPVVDPDDHHLWVSLGCAAETLALAATAFDLDAEATFVEGSDPRLELALKPSGGGETDPRVAAIPERQSTRSLFDGPPMTAAERSALAIAARRPGVGFRLAQDALKDALRDRIAAANTAQMSDPAFMAELEQWIRFSEASAVESGDGLFARTTGNPAVPRWLGRRLLPYLLDPEAESRRYAEQIDSSAALAVFVSGVDRPEGWVETGRAFQRFALAASHLGLAHAHVNQAVELPDVRREIADLLDLGRSRPSLLIRIGRAPPLPYSLRRPVDAVIA